MNGRQALTALAAVGVCAGGFGAAVLPASAELRTVTVTLLGGQTLTVTVDVPPGTPLDQIRIPGVSTPIIGISEAGGGPPVVAVPTPTPAPQPEPGPGDPGGGGGGSDRPQGDGSGGKPQRTTRLPKRTGDQAGTVTGGAQAPAGAGEAVARRKQRDKRLPGRSASGVPTTQNPAFALAMPGAAPIGVPNFFIEKFRIPPFLLPIYQAAGIQYGIRWEVLAAINEIETDYGRNLNVSSAGAVGWMQFLPSTWKAYGVDANRDGRKDPYNPVDAIFAAARYLRAAGAETDLRKAIFAYNHADWYVEGVLGRAAAIGALPAPVVGALTGLTQGRFPVRGRARYRRDARTRRAIRIRTRAGARIVAVNDGRVLRIGRSRRLGRHVILEDVHGNVYRYARLRRLARTQPAPPARRRGAWRRPRPDPEPERPASGLASPARRAPARRDGARRAVTAAAPSPAGHVRRSLGALAPAEDRARRPARPRPGGRRAGRRARRVPLHAGSAVVAGTVLGRSSGALRFEIRPASRRARRIDPRPILDGWRLLERTAIHRGRRGRRTAPTIGQILLMGKDALAERVLRNPRIELYDCGRRDVRAGLVDRRVLAALEYLAAGDLHPAVSSLRCGHSFYTASGNVSHHSSGNAVDISAINGVPIAGNQGAGSITEAAVRRLLTLQGTMRPDEVISLMTFEGATNAYAMGDHADHVHVGFSPRYGGGRRAARHADALLAPGQWDDLIERLGQIRNPRVPLSPSRYALRGTLPIR